MAAFNILMAVLLGLLALAQAAPQAGQSAALETIVAGNKTYEVVPIQWIVPINNTGTSYNVTIEGTKEDVFNHISQVHPAAAAAHAINETINAMTLAQNTESLSTHYDQGPYFCNLDRWARGNPYSIVNGADYLMRVPGKPANAPGPGACGRVSCSDNAAIYWCNDNKEEKVLDSFSAISDGATHLAMRCVRLPGTKKDGINGQQFYEDGWNVIVRGDKC